MTESRRFEVRDSVEMAEFTHGATFSPDGRYFVTVTERGVLPQGVTEDTLWLFDVAAVRRAFSDRHAVAAVSPTALARLSGAIDGGDGVLGQDGLILRTTWAPDSESVLLLGYSGSENRQLFRVRLDDRKLIELTPPTQDVVDYAMADASVVYFAGPNVSAANLWSSTDPSAPDIVTGTGQPFISLLYPNWDRHARAMPTRFEVWRIDGSRAEPVLETATDRPMEFLGSYNVSAMAVTPDGVRLVALVHPDDIPSSWEQYEVPDGMDYRRFRTDSPSNISAADYGRALQYNEFDFAKGTRRALLPAPVADFQRGGVDVLQAKWSPDGRYVAIAGTYLPLDEAAGAHRSIRPCPVAIVDSQEGGYQCLINRLDDRAGAVSDLRWKTNVRLQVNSSGATGAEYVRDRDGAHWTVTRDHSPAPRLPIDISVQQDLDEPPAVFANDSRTGRNRRIFDPNPQLAAIELGSVSRYVWHDGHGRTVYGGLAKPPGFVAGHRYPLVIQTHGFSGHRFFRVGYSETSNAGRALAGRGMLVLQVAEPRGEFDGTWREATENATNVYLAAIDQLDREGLIDPMKVGITGYSRSGFYVAKAITEQPERFAAAVVANADPGSLIGYYTYLDYIMPAYAKNAADAFAGSLPYGEGLQKWLERAPGFRTDRIRAPVLISAADPQHLISLWGLYAPLRDQGKPVDLQYIRSGQHNIRKPLAHQEMIVDWFDFWLNGHEELGADRAEQYARWRAMRPTDFSAAGGPSP